MLIIAFIAATSLPPKPDHYVTDPRHVMMNAKALDEKLAQYERDSSDQILVYVDQRLPPQTTIEQVGSEAMRQWGVGQEGKDNGAILFIFIDDRKMWIEVGDGLEGALTDAKSRDIIETVIKPQFKRGDYSTGIEEGVSAIIATIRGEPYKRSVVKWVAPTKREPQEPDLIFVEIREILIWVFGLIPWGFAMYAIYYLIRYRKFPQGGRGMTFSSGGGSWSSSSSSSSSFSGGGGSGGGGGASGSW